MCLAFNYDYQNILKQSPPIMVEGNIEFRTCQFALNYIVYTATILVLVTMVYTLSSLYLIKYSTPSEPTVAPATTDAGDLPDDIGIREDYAFLVENELNEIKYDRFRKAIKHPKTESKPNEHDDKAAKDQNASAIDDKGQLQIECPCQRMDHLRYFHLITRNPVCLVIYLGAIAITLAVGFCVGRRFGFSIGGILK
ncbi:hypothetical protein WDU94_008443 [Cyamophila willieti]